MLEMEQTEQKEQTELEYLCNCNAGATPMHISHSAHFIYNFQTLDNFNTYPTYGLRFVGPWTPPYSMIGRGTATPGAGDAFSRSSARPRDLLRVERPCLPWTNSSKRALSECAVSELPLPPTSLHPPTPMQWRQLSTFSVVVMERNEECGTGFTYKPDASARERVGCQ